MEYSLQTTKINKTNMESITYKQYVLVFNVNACSHVALYKNSMFNILWIMLGWFLVLVTILSGGV